MNILNPLTLPLTENGLIEASAGTGKTYTITTLYLRALLGLRDDSFELSPLNIDQILVVTFTEAATQELRERIRDKLKETQEALLTILDSNSTSKVDTTLKSLITRYIDVYLKNSCEEEVSKQEPISQTHAALSAYHRIQDALTLIDEAAIFTIHGFCQRCLSQFAFETKMAFEQNFEMDNKPYTTQALHDFWRQNAVNLKGLDYLLFKSLWRNPNALLKDLSSILSKTVVIDPNIDEQQYDKLMSSFKSSLAALHQQLQTSDFISAIRDSGVKATTSLIKKLPNLQRFISDDFGSTLLSIEELRTFSTDNLANVVNYKKGNAPISHPVCEYVDQVLISANMLLDSQLTGYWLAKAKQFIEQNSVMIKQEHQVLTPDDLLLQLRQALVSGDSTHHPLQNSIVTRYPLAFIDEFQDTDPVQYEIFDTLYSSPAYSPLSDEIRANMIMIGDPKQAIYKFRGADIYTYIKAKQALPESQHYTLSTNWRSHPDMIKAVNHFFFQSERKFENTAIPFVQVDAGQTDAAQLEINDENGSISNVPPKLSLFHLTANETQGGYSTAEAKTIMAKHCALDIADLLVKADTGQAMLATPSGDATKVKAGDIAVLVRKGDHAKAIKTALNALSIRSVFISRDSVFRSQLAPDLLRLIEAIHSPTQERKIKAAVATDFFVYDLTDLTQLQQNSKDWHRHLVCFHQAHELWIKGQIEQSIKMVLDFANTFTKWQNNDFDFERFITDYRHLLELIQQEALIQSGSEKLLVWLKQAITDENSMGSDDTSMRLESDSNLVQIVTMHSAKGLEYPIVYIPFATDFKEQKEALYHSERHHGLSLRVDKRKIEMQLAERERLAEDIRLLYVAMTRAKQRLVIGCYNLKTRSNAKNSSVELSAFGRLVLREGQVHPTEAQWQQAIFDLVAPLAVSTTLETSFANVQGTIFSKLESNADHLSQLVLLDPECVEHHYQIVSESASIEHGTLSKPNLALTKPGFSEFSSEIQTNWSLLSYSSLVGSATHKPWIAGLSDEGTDAHQIKSNLEKSEQSEEIRFRFTFPRGANAGSCMHEMYEHLEFDKPIADQRTIVNDALNKFGLNSNAQERFTEQTIEWLQETIDTEIDGWSLADLQADQRLDEMEFYFNIQSISAEILGNALSICGIDKAKINHNLLSGKGMQGLIKGFIDLTVYIEGKFYVLDYKSNHLGDNYSDYKESRLFEAMTDHNYHLQLLIYSYALHKWLSNKIQNYDYEQHVAGGIYLFLRGMHPQQSSNGVYKYKIPFEAISYLDNALQCGQSKGTLL